MAATPQIRWARFSRFVRASPIVGICWARAVGWEQNKHPKGNLFWHFVYRKGKNASVETATAAAGKKTAHNTNTRMIIRTHVTANTTKALRQPNDDDRTMVLKAVPSEFWPQRYEERPPSEPPIYKCFTQNASRKSIGALFADNILEQTDTHRSESITTLHRLHTHAHSHKAQTKKKHRRRTYAVLYIHKQAEWTAKPHTFDKKL